MKLRARLQRLERSSAFDGHCPACRPRRGTSVTVFSEERDDGTVTEPEGMPLPCERCGEVPEQVFHVLEVVVGGPAAASDQAAGVLEGESSAAVVADDPDWSLDRSSHAEDLP